CHRESKGRNGVSDEILVEREGGIATVVFNRPKVRNAVSLAMWGEIANVTESLAKDDSVRAVVYRGAGRDAFASGADISEFQENRKDTETAPAYAQDILYSARSFEAGEAFRIGFIQRLVPADDLETSTYDYLRTVAENAPLSIRGTKTQVQAIFEGVGEAHRRKLFEMGIET